MNTRMLPLAFVLTAAACGGAESRPAQEPPMATAAATPSDVTGAVAPAPAPNSAATSATVETDPFAPRRSGAKADSQASAPPRAPERNANEPEYGVTPAVVNNPGAADQTKNADNTKINERDRQGTLTPMDQGNSGSEINITATIRKGIMGDKTLSFTAKNAKVITVGNKVTLRGPVKSAQEKAAIEALAKQTAGVREVDNQLEVKK